VEKANNSALLHDYDVTYESETTLNLQNASCLKECIYDSTYQMSLNSG